MAEQQSRNIMDYDTVRLDDENNAVVIIDQTKLPGKIEIISLHTAQEIWNAIYLLQVRGAPAIGVAAAYGIYVLAKRMDTEDYDTFYREFVRQKEAGRGIHCRLAVIPRILHAHPQKCTVDLLIDLSRQHPDTDLGIDVDKTSSHRITVKIVYQHHFAVLKCSGHRVDLIVKHPHSSGFDGSSLTFF